MLSKFGLSLSKQHRLKFENTKFVRGFSSTPGPYVLVDKTTKVICQGFTGKQVNNNQPLEN
jgi:hypothetical protein